MQRRILLIDDDRMQAMLVRGFFTEFHGEQFDLDWAATYEEGLARLLNGDYAAALLDFQLGRHNGLELLREATARGCRIPIVFLTSETSEAIDIEAMNAGAQDFLVKTEITPRSLQRSLRYAMKLTATLEALRSFATHDQLTGLLNRREFDRILVEETERARRFQRPLALAIADIDLFKQVNDTHGHLLGDFVLHEVARRLQAQVRSVDRVMRYGGEEFALLLMETSRSRAAEEARGLCAAMEREPVLIGAGEPLPIRISVGVAVMPDDAATADALVGAADQALYAAKERGRNRAVTFAELKT
jgi:two-component system, cell cycle response regulator